jgi:hypothetical protein
MVRDRQQAPQCLLATTPSVPKSLFLKNHIFCTDTHFGRPIKRNRVVINSHRNSTRAPLAASDQHLAQTDRNTIRYQERYPPCTRDAARNQLQRGTLSSLIKAAYALNLKESRSNAKDSVGPATTTFLRKNERERARVDPAAATFFI